MLSAECHSSWVMNSFGLTLSFKSVKFLYHYSKNVKYGRPNSHFSLCAIMYFKLQLELI